MKNIPKIYSYQYRNAAPSCAHAYLWPAILKLLPKDKKLRILDLGCGNGNLSHLIAGCGHEVIGIDSSRSGIELAQKNFPECNFIEANIYNLPR